MTKRLHALLVVATLTGGALPGCSLVLDPDNCSSDTECDPGTCQDGVCVGPAAGGEGGEGGMGGGGAGGEDDAGLDEDAATGGMGGGGAGGEGGEGGTGGVAGEGGAGGMPPDPVAPRCSITAPGPDARLVNQPDVTFTLEVEDADTPPAELQVEFGPMGAREAVSLDADGNADVPRVLESGATVFSLRAVDPDGLSCSATVTVVADFEGPVLALTTPAGPRLDTNDTPFTLEGTVNDANPARTLEITRGGEALAVAPTWLDRGQRFTVPVDLVAGENALSVVTVDAAGNRSTPAEVLLVLDQSAPTVAIESPAADATLFTATTDISGVVQNADGSPEATAALQITINGPQAGQRNRAQNVRTNAEGRFEVAARPLYEGENRIEVCAEDPAGNEACVTRTVTRAQAVPCVSIETPADDHVVGAGQLAVAGTVCPVVTSVTLHVGDAAPVPGQIADGRFTGSVQLPGAGEHQVRVVAATADGATASDTHSVVFDDSPPSLRLTRPTNSACVTADAVEVCGSATDHQSGVATVQVNGVAAEVVAGGGFCATVALDEGLQRTIDVVATNGAGLEAREQVQVNADAAPPVITIDQADDAWLGLNDVGRVLITGNVDVGVCGVPGLFVTIDAVRAEAGLEPNGNWRHARALPDGAHVIRVDTTDSAGQAAEAEVRIHVDGTPPVISDVTPAPPGLVNAGLAEVSARVSDGDGSGIVSATIAGEAVEVRAGRISRQVLVNVGLNEITLTARDQVGNETEITTTLYRDTTGPTVVITGPLDGTAVPLPALVTGTVTDATDTEPGSGVDSVRVNGVAATVAPDGTWKAVNVPVDVDNPVITAVATDGQGNDTAAPPAVNVLVRDFAVLAEATYGVGGASNVGAVAVGDFDGNDRIDLIAVSDDAGTASRVFVQQADGAFQALGAGVVGLQQLAGADDAAVGDFDSDGALDLLAWGDTFISLWLGDGEGGFAGPNDNLPDGAGQTDVVVGDFSRDGTLDLLMLAGADTRVYYGRPDNTVYIPDTPDLVGLSEVTAMERAALADFDGDGLLDLVAAGPGGLRIWSGGVDPRFVAEQHFAGAEYAADSFLLVDADRDAALDVITRLDGAGHLYLGDRANGFDAPIAGPDAAGDRAMATLDLDGDARDDLVFATDTGLRALRAEVDGFSPFDLAAAGVPDLGPLNTVSAVDLDADGDIDLVAGGPAGLVVLRSNMSVTHADTWRTVRVDARRARVDEVGPRDGTGVTLYQDISGGPNPERAILCHPSAPTVVTIPAPADDTVLEARYPDRGDRGIYVNPIGQLRAGQSLTIHDPAN